MSKIFRHNFFGSFRKLSQLLTPQTSVDYDVDSATLKKHVLFLGPADSGKSALALKTAFAIDSTLSERWDSSTASWRVMQSLLEELVVVLAVLRESALKAKDGNEIKIKESLEQVEKLRSDPESLRNFDTEFIDLVLKVSALPGFEDLFASEYIPHRQAKPRKLRQIAAELRELGSSAPNWQPETEHMILCLTATTGSTTLRAKDSEGGEFFLTDCGGAHCERKKWWPLLGAFESGKKSEAEGAVVVFCVSLVDLDAPLFESQESNRLSDSLLAFSNLVQDSRFSDCDLRKLFVVFTKDDVFAQSLKMPSTRNLLQTHGIDVALTETGQVSTEECNRVFEEIEALFLAECDDILSLKGENFVKVRRVSVMNPENCSDLAAELQNELL